MATTVNLPSICSPCSQTRRQFITMTMSPLLSRILLWRWLSGWEWHPVALSRLHAFGFEPYFSAPLAGPSWTLSITVTMALKNETRITPASFCPCDIQDPDTITVAHVEPRARVWGWILIMSLGKHGGKKKKWGQFFYNCNTMIICRIIHGVEEEVFPTAM